TRSSKCELKANGKLGPEFSVGRGVKQGCPLSVTLFGLFIEMLSRYIDSHDRDCRVRLPERWRLLLADDETAKYLGLHHGSGRKFTACTKEVLASGRRAICALNSLCREKCVHVP
ncbi:hypothetical protein TSOC_014744, partial [Tetrabaena socialis]